MTTRITQIERLKGKAPTLEVAGDQPDGSTIQNVAADTGNLESVFKVEGTLCLKDAELLERICRDLGNQTRRPVTLELSELCYLDSDSASVLCRMKREQDVRLEGLHLFVEKVVELAEECEKASKYLPKREDAAQKT